MEILDRISENLQRADVEQVSGLVRQAIDQGIDASDILERGLIAGMNVVGERFRVHEIFLPEVLLSAKAMTAGMGLLKPLLVQGRVPNRGRVVLGSVQGDLHDIGKNLVGIMLEGAGFEVIDLGHDVAPESFLDTAVREGAPVIGMSALLTTTMSVMRNVVELIEERGLKGKIKVIVGGAPVSEQFALEVGADAYGYDAANAVERVKQLIETG